MSFPSVTIALGLESGDNAGVAGGESRSCVDKLPKLAIPKEFGTDCIEIAN